METRIRSSSSTTTRAFDDVRAHDPRGGRVRGHRRGRGRSRCADGDRELQPDLVLLDVQLPDMDGFAVLEQLGSNAPSVVLVSSSDACDYDGLIRKRRAAASSRRPSSPAPPFVAAPVTRRRLAAAVGLGAVLYTGAFSLVRRRSRRPPHAHRDDHRRGPDLHRHGAIAAAPPARQPDRCADARSGAPLVGGRPPARRAALSGLHARVPPARVVAFIAFAQPDPLYPTGGSIRGTNRSCGLVLALVTIGPSPVSLIDPTPIPGCDDCPQNAFLLSDRPGWPRPSAVGLGSLPRRSRPPLRPARARFRAASPPCAASSAPSTSSP